MEARFFSPVPRILVALVLLLFGHAQGFAQQPQTPNSGSVSVSYDWVPYPGNPSVSTLTQGLGASNSGTPVINLAPTDTYRGGKYATSYRYNNDNCDGAFAGNSESPDFFTVSLDRTGDVQLLNPELAGTLSYVKNYQSITLRRINPATGLVRSGYPIRLDNHTGVCQLPRMLKDSGGNIFILWKETKTAGDQIMAAHLNVTADTLDAKAQNICGGRYFVDIRELDVAAEDLSDHGVAVIIREHYAESPTGYPAINDDRILVQRIKLGAGGIFSLLWPEVGSSTTFTMRQVGGNGIGTEQNRGAYSPKVVFNRTSQDYEFVWAARDTTWEITWNSSSLKFDTTVYQIDNFKVQTESVLSLTENYGLGGIKLDLGGRTNYSFTDFKVVSAKYSSAQSRMILYARTKDANGIHRVTFASFLLNSTGPVKYAQTIYPTADFDGGWPLAILKRQVTTSQEDVLGFYISGATCQHTVGVTYFTQATGTAQYANTNFYPRSFILKGFLGSTNAGVFAAIADLGFIDFLKISYPPSLSLFLAGRERIRTISPKGLGYEIDTIIGCDGYDTTGKLDTYFATAFSPSGMGVISYEYGVDTITRVNPADQRYRWVQSYGVLQTPLESDDVHRETEYAPNTYKFYGYSTSGSSPFVARDTERTLQENVRHEQANTTANQDNVATAYVSTDELFNASISLRVMDKYGANPRTFSVASASDGSRSFFQPVVALGTGLWCGTNNFAIVTYVALTQTPSLAQHYCYRIVDLTVDTVGGEQVIETMPTPTEDPYFRNWGVASDQVSPGFVFAFSTQHATQSGRRFKGQLQAALFNGCGAYATTSTVQAYSGNTIDQVRIIADPDPLNAGAYIAWRETPSSSTLVGNGATINLAQLNTVSGSLWGAGILSHVPSNVARRTSPALTATTAWVFLTWEDMQSGYSRIYGSPWTNTGGALPGSNFNGTALSGSTNDAHHPDVIVNPELTNIATVAWDESCTSNPLLNTWRNIRLMNCRVNLAPIIGTQLDLTTPHSTPTLAGSATMTDARWSLYGYMQRRPKLVAVNASTGPYPYDRLGVYANLQNWLVCAYETQAYNLYGSGASCSSAGSLTGAYQSMWNDEKVRSGGENSGYLQNNIAAKAINPNLVAGPTPNKPLIGGELCLAASTNAQDIVSIVASPGYGPVATLLDYSNTANANAQARTLFICPNYYMSPNSGLTGTWAPPTASHGIQPYLINSSWMPLEAFGAAGTPTAGIFPSGTWSINSSFTTQTVPALQAAATMVDYVSPGFPSALRVTAHVGSIAGQWPLSFPDDWGLTGDVPSSNGYGYKTNESVTEEGMKFSLSENPAVQATMLTVQSGKGHSLTYRVSNSTGATLLQLTGAQLASNAEKIPISVSNLASGEYFLAVLERNKILWHTPLIVRR